MKIVVFGARGWIAQHLLPLLRALPGGPEVEEAPPELRADDDAKVLAYLTAQFAGTPPAERRVVSLIGRTHGPGTPTIDYLERPGGLHENVRDNLYAPVALACACAALTCGMR